MSSLLLTALVVYVVWKFGVLIVLAVVYSNKSKVLDRVTDLNPTTGE
jgi:hypothetical protein